jgi:flagellar basal-body rod protein FlgB
MLSGLFNSTAIPVLEQVVNFTEARHNVLAGNIANLDTPGYRARDLPPAQFQAQMKEAIEQRDRPSGEFSGVDRAKAVSEVGRSMRTILRHDDNNTGLENQVSEMSKNQMQYSLALSIMTSQFRLLQAAVSERV